DDDGDEDSDKKAANKKQKQKLKDKDKPEDWFGLPKMANEKAKENNKDDEDDEDDNDDKKKKKKKKKETDESQMSTFEQEQELINARIAALEEENLKDRSWEMMGEIGKYLTARHLKGNDKMSKKGGDNDSKVGKRPKNSLLEMYLEFDNSDKLKPTVTDEVTAQIEQLVIERIQEEKFDDVTLEDKIDWSKLPMQSKRKLVEVADTKSSMGLAEMYERQYLQQVQEQNQAQTADTEQNVDKELIKSVQ
ncbi:U3 small nucleolar ribonucleoprotein mpp10, partial [Reticulomyxa filosa]